MAADEKGFYVSDVNKYNIAPFLTIIVMKRNASSEFFEIHSGVVEKILKDSKDETSIGETKQEKYPDSKGVIYTSYNVFPAPSWLKGLNDKNLERNVAVSIYLGDYIAFYFSQRGTKDKVRELVEDGVIKGLDFVESSIFNYLFVNEDKVNMLWLSGIHGKEASKADSKVLGGGGVVDTLDPILDQSYVMSAARTEVDLDAVGVSLGINPFKSSVWRGPCNDWDQFEGRVFSILQIVADCKGMKDNPVSFLSYPINDCKELGWAYDFSISDPDFLPSGMSRRKEDLLRVIWQNYTFKLQDSLNGDYVWMDIFFKGKFVGDVKFDIKIKKRKVVFEVTKYNPKKGFKYQFRKFLMILDNPELVKIWFESGHAIVNGMIYKTGYVDVEYEDFIWDDFSNYELKREKPGKLKTVPELGKVGKEKSLFCWVLNKWTGCWHEPSEYSMKGRGRGWLYCDDGAGEKADFIHYIEWKGVHYISLIHVKAAKSDGPDRKISVGAHDVVLSQAVKNIRYCFRKNLVSELLSRADNAKEKYCWFDGKLSQPDNFIEKLNELPNNGSVKSRVVVVQPHTMKSYYLGASTKIKNQLDVLLVSAQTSIRSAGSSFYIIGSE